MKVFGFALASLLALGACDNKTPVVVAPEGKGFAPGLGHDEYETVCLGGHSYVTHKSDKGALAPLFDADGDPLKCHT